ncbi:hypothetical protein QN277_023525 [Acacia crassicarpa]|uniref:DNA repair RAD52-like protein 2, chloroplastic n=1 Tax=Acacia crassicarpa TaxID=499986 RepID=A0AAE1JHC1_9FABA|nr:hypothetical protein QN277_023525 [Acacia crassicarpa]
MASSISRNLISFIGIGNRPSTSPSFSCGNETPTLGAVLVRAPPRRNLRRTGLPGSLSIVSALERSNSGGDSSDGKNGGVSFSSSITRPIADILSDLNKRIPDNIVKTDVHGNPLIPWYHANRMLNLYAPGWDGQIYDVVFSNDGSVTVIYIITVIGSDGGMQRMSTGTVYPSDGLIGDPVAVAEELAFCKACVRFGLGLYLYHED